MLVQAWLPWVSAQIQKKQKASIILIIFLEDYTSVWKTESSRVKLETRLVNNSLGKRWWGLELGLVAGDTEEGADKFWK